MKKQNIKIESPASLKGINCPKELNSGAIDEFLVIFQLLQKQRISYFSGLEELNQKKVRD